MNDTEKLAKVKEIAKDYLDYDTPALHEILNVIDGYLILPPAPDVEEYSFIVSVTGCTKEQAEQVMCERIGPDEDYGFSYRIDWRPV